MKKKLLILLTVFAVGNVLQATDRKLNPALAIDGVVYYTGVENDVFLDISTGLPGAPVAGDNIYISGMGNNLSISSGIPENLNFYVSDYAKLLVNGDVSMNILSLDKAVIEADVSSRSITVTPVRLILSGGANDNDGRPIITSNNNGSDPENVFTIGSITAETAGITFVTGNARHVAVTGNGYFRMGCPDPASDYVGYWRIEGNGAKVLSSNEFRVGPSLYGDFLPGSFVRVVDPITGGGSWGTGIYEIRRMNAYSPSLSAQTIEASYFRNIVINPQAGSDIVINQNIILRQVGRFTINPSTVIEGIPAASVTINGNITNGLSPTATGSYFLKYGGAADEKLTINGNVNLTARVVASLGGAGTTLTPDIDVSFPQAAIPSYTGTVGIELEVWHDAAADLKTLIEQLLSIVPEDMVVKITISDGSPESVTVMLPEIPGSNEGSWKLYDTGTQAVDLADSESQLTYTCNPTDSDLELRWTESSVQTGGKQLSPDKAEIVSVKYYTLNGIEISQPDAKGIFVQKIMYADGKLEVLKVVN